MTRSCPVERCEVLIASDAPMCAKHWAKVPEKLQKAVDDVPTIKARMQAVESLSELGTIAETLLNDWKQALAYAAKEPPKNTGRTGAGLPPGSTVA